MLWQGPRSFIGAALFVVGVVSGRLEVYRLRGWSPIGRDTSARSIGDRVGWVYITKGGDRFAVDNATFSLAIYELRSFVGPSTVVSTRNN